MADIFHKYCEEAAEQPLPSSEDETDGCEDEDTCSATELAKEFHLPYKLKDETVVSLKKDYVLSLSADGGYTRLAVGLSNAAVQTRDLESAGTLTSSLEVKGKDDSIDVTICGVHFLEASSHTLLVGSTDGLVRLYDLRASGEQARFEYKSDLAAAEVPPVPKSQTCFDCNANGRIICSGTEQYMGNVYLKFYDVRERKQLGVYFESHQDDVTSVNFHKRNPDLLCSGGTDGLINVFDIKQPDEDEALLNTINTESSVHRLNWHRNVYEQDIISCITHTNDFKSYDCQEGDELVSFERFEITKAIRRKQAGNFNLINAHNLEDEGIFLLAGTNFNRGEILRSVSVPSKQKLQPLANFVGNKQIVRESLYDAKRNWLITGGESGIISVWTPDTADQATHSSGKLKSKSKTKSNKKTPY